MVKKDKSLIEEFVEISKYFGQRFDLTQAAGGNSSIKIGKKMYIKSSGYSLSEVSLDNGYTILDNLQLVKFLNNIKNSEINQRVEKKSIKILRESVLHGPSPSIESYSHTLLKKYTIHIHPIASNIVSVDKESREPAIKEMEYEKI